MRMIAEIFASWLIPGFGFFIKGERRRGLAIFVLFTLTFAIGLLLKGTVVFPVWTPGKEGFNIINILTFFHQLGYGSLSILCLLSHYTGWKVFSGEQSFAFFDLATYYLIVAGGLNYLMLFNFYDRHYAKRRHQLRR